MNPNTYRNQKLRGIKRKYEIFLERGGKCERCGYDKNLGALDFHHRDPNEKEFQIDLRRLGNGNLDKLKQELDKCDLLCANCHREIHNPDLDLNNIPNLTNELVNSKLSFSNQHKYKHYCEQCGKPIKDYSGGKKYCSEQCKWDAKNYPSLDELIEQYNVLKSWQKVADYFGITRRVIQGIRRRRSS